MKQPIRCSPKCRCRPGQETDRVATYVVSHTHEFGGKRAQLPGRRAYLFFVHSPLASHRESPRTVQRKVPAKVLPVAASGGNRMQTNNTVSIRLKASNLSSFGG
jgi:hypothetical protein